jgi:hypothetical protein
MRGHMLEVELNTLDPKSFDNIQDFFTKFKSLILSLGECGIDKSTQEKQLILTILAKLGPEYVVYVSNFHSGRCLFGTNWKMPTLAQFIESLTQEKTKLIQMGLMKDPKAHALTMHDGKGSSKQNRKEGYSKPFNDSSGSKDSSDSKKKKKGKQCTYCNKPNHEESTCMKKQIDLMAHALQQNNLGNFIPEGVKKQKEEDHAPKKGNHHALVAINSSSDSWIIDSGASHHMAAKEEVFSSLSPCSRPPILMGDDTPVAVAGEGRVELHNGSFENVLHVPNLSMNLLSVYQITQKGKKVEFTSDSVSVIDMHDNSIIAIGEVDHKSRLYKFTKFSDNDSSILLTHKESTLHAPPVQHAYTLVLPSVSDIRDDSIHSDFVHGNKQVVHPDKKPTSKLQQMPKKAQTTLQEVGNLAGNPLDSRRTRSQHEEPSHVFSASEPVMPMHCYMVQSTDPQNYNRVVGNPLWQEAMQKEYDSLLQNQTWNLVPLPPERNIFRCRWVHRIKRYKARQVAKGLHQIHKYFYIFTKTFSEQKFQTLRDRLAVKNTVA